MIPVDGTQYLVLDQGGHAGRASVFDGAGGLLAQAVHPVETVRHGDGRVEQDAEGILGSMARAIEEVAAQPAVDIRAVRDAGLACQRSSIVCWHLETGEPLTPVLSWQDTRAESVFDEVTLDATTISAITGLPPVPHYGATKLAWCLRHVGPVKAAFDDGVLGWGPLASFLMFRLLDQRPYRINHTIAQRMLLFDVHACEWSQVLLDAFGIPRASLPDCVPDHSLHGHLVVGGTRIPFNACAGDQNVVPLAFGAQSERDTCLNAGTGAFMLRMLAAGERAQDGMLQTLVEDSAGRRRFATEGTVNGAGAAFDWLSRIEGGRDIPWGRLDDMRPDPDMPLFINTVGDLGSPFWRTGIAPYFEPDRVAFEQRVYAIAESIAFLVRANHERMPKAARVQLAGGLSRSDKVCRLLASALAMEIVRTVDTDMTSRGVLALLTGQPAQPPGEPDVFAADPAWTSLLEARYRRWRMLLDDAIQAA